MPKNPYDPRQNPYFEKNRATFLRHISPYYNEYKCDVWVGAKYFKYGKRIPYMWMRMPDGTRKQVYARRFAFALQNRRPVPEGIDIRCSCGEDLCVKIAPGHCWEFQHGKDLERVTVQHRQGGAIVIKAVRHTRNPQHDFSEVEVAGPIPTEEEFMKGKK